MRESVQDNIYPLGTRVVAKEDPTRLLIIDKYYQRIYYCSVADDPGHKHLPYFERELIPSENVITKKVTPS